MGKTKNGRRYPEELRPRAVRMVLDHESEYAIRSAAILPISQKIGCSGDSLRIWVKQHETDTGKRDGLTTSERDRIRELERENRQLRAVLFDPPFQNIGNAKYQTRLRMRSIGIPSSERSRSEARLSGLTRKSLIAEAVREILKNTA